MPKQNAEYQHCTNCGTKVQGETAKAAADPNTIYCRYSGDRLVGSKCPNSGCPLFNVPQGASANVGGSS